MARPDNATILKGAMDSSDPIEASVTVNDIAAVQPEGIDPYQQQIYDQMRRYNSTIPVQARSTYFPSADIPINKGSYSGSIVGNVPIFAPSELVPYGVFDARQQALKDAAAAKAKELDDFNKMFAVAPETSRKAVQQQLQSGYYDWLNKWEGIGKQRYGDDWTKYLKGDTQFLKEQQSWQTLAQYNTQLVDQVAEMNALIKTGDFNASPETLRSRNAVLSGVDGLAKPGDPNAGALSQNVLRFTLDYDLDKAVNTELDKLIQDTYESYPGISSQGIYDLLTSTKTTGTNKNKVQMLSDSLYATRYAGSDYITPEMIQRNIEAKLGKKVERKFETQANQFSNAGGAADVYTDNDIEETSQFNTTAAVEGEGETYSVDENGKTILVPASNDRTEAVTSYAGVSFKKPIVTTTAKGETMTDLATGSPVKTTGSETISWGETKVVPTYRNPDTGAIIVLTDKQMETPWKLPANVEYRTMAIGKYKEPKIDASTGAVIGVNDVTVAKPASELENALVSQRAADGKIIRGIPLDKQDQRAAQLNQEKKLGSFAGQQSAGQTTQSAPQYVQTKIVGGVTYGQDNNGNWYQIQ